MVVEIWRNPPVTNPNKIPSPSVDKVPDAIKKELEIMPIGEARANKLSRTSVQRLDKELESTAAKAKAAGALC